MVKSIFFTLLMLILPFSYIYSDYELELICTITPEEENKTFGKLFRIGDINADGYPDIAINVYPTDTSSYEAVYVYYGGSDFDIEPDLIILGPPQNPNSDCVDIGEYLTGFGSSVSALGDFNGDGYDDIAISAGNYCLDILFEGRIYIYYGNPNPNAIPNLILDGFNARDQLGVNIGSGDFNGDGFQDLLTGVNNLYYSYSTLYIYYGGEIPDNQYDWSKDNGDYTTIMFSDLVTGYDLNDDGFDDYQIRKDSFPNIFYQVYMGGEPPLSDPLFSSDEIYILPIDDISGDNIDDLILYSSLGWGLSVGGDSLEMDYDYFFDGVGDKPSTYNLQNGEKILLLDNILGAKLLMYNTGVPFDSVAYDTLHYDVRHYWDPPVLGDINADGKDEIGLFIWDDTVRYIDIYTTTITSPVIDDNNKPPEKESFISCYPNPFNLSCNITVYGDDIRQVMIYNIVGRLIATVSLSDSHGVWDASGYSSGIYFAKIEKSDNVTTIKLVLLK